MRMYIRKSLLGFVSVVVILMISFLPRVSWSENYNITNLGGKATTEQFIEALKPSVNESTQNSGEGLEFRSLGLGGASQTLSIASKKAASLELKFEFASYQLTEGSKKYLDKLGLALQNNKLAQDHFLVEGHTDSRGSKEYNMMLSRNRALSVKQYLVSNFDIESNRLSAKGRGENDLVDKRNPESSLNRRVQIVNLR